MYVSDAQGLNEAISTLLSLWYIIIYHHFQIAGAISRGVILQIRTSARSNSLETLSRNDVLLNRHHKSFLLHAARLLSNIRHICRILK